MNATAVSLGVFVLVLVVNVCALLLDYFLAVNGMTTITHLAHKHPWIATVIILWQIVGAVALAIHFAEYGKGLHAT